MLKKDHRVTLRISEDLHVRLKKAARQSKKRPSDVLRDALEKHLGQQPAKSAYELFEEAGLIGIVKDTPADLSTNKKYFEGFGES